MFLCYNDLTETDRQIYREMFSTTLSITAAVTSKQILFVRNIKIMRQTVYVQVFTEHNY